MYSGISIKELIKIERIFSIFKADFPYKYTFKGESHNFWECVYVAEGSVCVSADGRVYHLKKNEIIFHKPLEFHKFIIENKNGATLCIFSFSASGDFCQKIADYVCEANEHQQQIIFQLYSYLERKYNQNISIEDSEKIYKSYLQFLENPIISQTVATYISQIILATSQNVNITPNTNKYDEKVFNKAVEILNDNINSFVSIKDLSEFLSVSESTLKRIFKKYADISVHRYLIMLKIKKATLLLSEGKSANEVSEQLGFSSQAYFSIFFKRETGRNPSEKI